MIARAGRHRYNPMTMRPAIGINLEYETEPNERSILRPAYYDAVFLAGGLPVLLPPIAGAGYVELALDVVDGLLLTGGDDLDPRLYGAEPHPSIKLIASRRQEFDLELARGAIERRLPVLAICCGMQTLNVILGGDLFQDIAAFVPGAQRHTPQHRGLRLEHEVRIEPGTALERIAGARSFPVVSTHHQAVRRLAPGLRAAAFAKDGVIEAFESEAPDKAGPSSGEVLVLGVQWHPERAADSAPHRALFDWLVRSAKARREARRRLELR